MQNDDSDNDSVILTSSLVKQKYENRLISSSVGMLPKIETKKETEIIPIKQRKGRILHIKSLNNNSPVL
jgi:hypothetical protein